MWFIIRLRVCIIAGEMLCSLTSWLSALHAMTDQGLIDCAEFKADQLYTSVLCLVSRHITCTVASQPSFAWPGLAGFNSPTEYNRNGDLEATKIAHSKKENVRCLGCITSEIEMSAIEINAENMQRKLTRKIDSLSAVRAFQGVFHNHDVLR